MSIGGVVIQFAADTRKAVRDIDKLTKSLQDSGKRARSAGSMFSGALKAGIAGVGVAAVGAGIAFVDMAKAAYSDAQAARRLERTLKTVRGVTDEAADSAAAWIDKMELLTLVSDDDLRQALANLVVVTEDLTDAQKLTALAADASVGSGREFATVATAMAKAAGGNVSALQRLFPQLDAGPDKILTFEEAMSQLRDTYKGAAQDAADNDLFGRLSAAWGQIKEAVGQAALPSLEEVSAWFADPKNVESIQEWINKVGEWSRTIGEDFRNQIESFVKWLGSPQGQSSLKEFQGTLGDVADAFSTIAEAVDAVTGTFDDLAEAWNKLPGWLKGDIGDFIGRNGKYNPFAPQNTPWTSDDRRSGGGSAYNSGGAYANSSGDRVNVTIVNNNPKPETASSSTAASLRTARNLSKGW